MLLGAIADDLTGATDLALMLARNGLRTVQTIGVPKGNPTAEAAVVALKSRTIPADEAVDQSLAALQWLRAQGARQFFFKYCSTFDSTPEGNIGPVADALLDALGSDFTIVCPAFPANRRTVYLGHLFTGDVLLSESSMRHHPLTPMTDSNLLSVLGRQTPHRVGLIHYPVVAAGVDSIRRAIGALRADGVRYAIVDAVLDQDLRAIGAAAADLPLLTGGSGIAMGLPENFRLRGLAAQRDDAPALEAPAGHAAVLAGSCSDATLGQIAAMRQRAPAFFVDANAIAAGEDVAAAALRWATPLLPQGPVLIHASAPPAEVAAVQARLGRQRAGEMIEATLASIGRGLVDAGVRRLVVAGGETSGAVVNALGIAVLEIGPEIDPGVPWTLSLSDPKLLLALKSGNFGGTDFFAKAFRILQ